MDPALLLAAGIVLVACGVAWQVPSQAHWALLVVGFAMDPIRKVVPGQPVWLTGVVAGVLVLVYVRQQQPDLLRARPPLLRGAPELVVPLQLAGLWVAFQAVRGYESTGSPMVSAIGVLSYVAPAIALAVGYGLAASVPAVRRVLMGYVACIVVFSVTVLMSFVGVKATVLQQVGKGLVIYGGETGVIQLHSGLLRGPEMAGWHLGTAICLLALLVATARHRFWLGLALPTVGLLGMALVVTGRRKYLAAVLMFLAVWALFSWAYRRRRVLAMLATLSVAAVALGALALDSLLERPGLSVLETHAQRVELGGDQAQHRLLGLTVHAIPAAIEHNGFLGAGAGVGSQGAQHFRAGAVSVGWAAEGGLGKLVAELGVPGLGIALWLLALVAWRALRTARLLAWQRRPGADEACALLALLAACALTFTMGHQVYGDPFVLTVVGFLAGMLLRLPACSSPQAPSPTGLALRGMSGRAGLVGSASAPR